MILFMQLQLLLPVCFISAQGFACSYISCSNNISCFAPSKHDKNWSRRHHQCPVVPKDGLSHVPDDSVSERRHTQQWYFHPVILPCGWVEECFEKCHSFGGQSEGEGYWNIQGEDNSIHGEDVLWEGSLRHIFHGIYVDEKDPDKEQQSSVKTEIKLLKFRWQWFSLNIASYEIFITEIFHLFPLCV